MSFPAREFYSWQHTSQGENIIYRLLLDSDHFDVYGCDVHTILPVNFEKGGSGNGHFATNTLGS